MPNIKEKLIALVDDYTDQLSVRDIHEADFADRFAGHLLSSGLVEELQNEAYDLGVDSALHNHFGLSWEDAAGLRKEIKSLQETTRWIPVTEKLPEHSNGHVLVTDGERIKISCRNAFYSTAMGETRCAQGYGAGMSVTHWMPLPELPGEDTKVLQVT